MGEIEELPRFQRTAGILKKEIPPSADVIEIGSDEASFRHLITARSWTTIDKYGNPDIRADIDGPQAQLPLPDSSVDAVICTEVLEHLVGGSTFIRELARVLKPGGAAYITVPNMTSLGNRIKWALGRVPFMAASGDCGHELGGTGVLMDGRWVAGHVVDFNTARLNAYLERGGLRVVKNWSLGASLGSRIHLPPRLVKPTLSDFVFAKAIRP